MTTQAKTSRARAFVLEPFDLPLRNAAEYGDVTYVYGPDADRPSIWSDEFIPHAMSRLDQLGYDPEVDYFVVTGHQVPLVLVVAALSAHCAGVKLLLWSATDRQYVARDVEAAAV